MRKFLFRPKLFVKPGEMARPQDSVSRGAENAEESFTA